MDTLSTVSAAAPNKAISQCMELFVSGRLCLFGEHSDWAGEFKKTNSAILPGRTIVVGTQEGIHARACRSTSPILSVTATTELGEVLGPLSLSLNTEELLVEAQKGGFWSYIAGTAYRILLNFDVGGADIDNYKTTLPMSKGLSSSAAICVMVARAFNLLYDLKLTTRGEMELAYQGEIATPSKCGRMDQGCAYGAVPIIMSFDADVLHVERVPLTCTLYLVLVDLCASKSTRDILVALQSAYPFPTTAQHERLHELLGIVNTSITACAEEALKYGDVEELGRLMVEAQREFDCRAAPLCPEQLKAPVLHDLLAYAPIQGLIFGGKGVGSQGDGTAQLLCRSASAQLEVCEIVTRNLHMHCMPLTVQPTKVTGFPS